MSLGTPQASAPMLDADRSYTPIETRRMPSLHRQAGAPLAMLPAAIRAGMPPIGAEPSLHGVFPSG